MHPDAGRRRVIIEGIQPAIDAGRFPIKRTIGEQVGVEAEQEVQVDVLIGAELIEAASQRATGVDAAELQERARWLRRPLESGSLAQARLVLEDTTLRRLMAMYPDRHFATTSPGEFA